MVIKIPSFSFCPQCGNQYEANSRIAKNCFKCKRCNFIFWIKPQISVSILAIYKGRVLVVQRNNDWKKGWWCLPGGFVDYDESPMHAAVREFKEEVGVHIKTNDLQLLNAYHDRFDSSGTGVDIIYTVNLSDWRISSEADGEVKNISFVDPKNLPIPFNAVHKEAIRQYRSRH